MVFSAHVPDSHLIFCVNGTYGSVVKCKLILKNVSINTLSKLVKLQMMKKLRIESWPFRLVCAVFAGRSLKHRKAGKINHAACSSIIFLNSIYPATIKSRTFLHLSIEHTHLEYITSLPQMVLANILRRLRQPIFLGE